MKRAQIGEVIGSILDELKPEGAYFTAVDGKQGAYLVVDLQEASQLPAVAEPFFLALNATLEAIPVMTAEGLMRAGPARAGPAIEQAVQRYRRA